jgi:hypothetical protein
MGGEQRRSLPGEDHISGLPDEMLHDILACLHCARATVRTSILSRRWRQVWAHLPGLVLAAGDDPDPSPPTRAPFMDAVDAALGVCLVPILEHLSIIMSHPGLVGRVVSWLRFAAQREVGALYLSVPSPP